MDSNKPCQPTPPPAARIYVIKLDYFPPSIIRQPPPPPAAHKEAKMKPEMIGGNNRSTRTYYLRSSKRKRKRLTDIESLPDEVLFEVLVRLPAQDIYNPARLVCSKWYHMIHTHTFIYAHLQRSTYGLLFQSTNGDSFFMSVGESGRVEISKKRYNLKNPLQTSCNGLLLEHERGSKYNIYVSNPATRQIFALPPFVGYTKYSGIHCFGIAYAAASMEYKVVILAPVEGRKKICYILTIGVDNSWRSIGSECESLQTKEFVSTPLITEGFVHWYIRDTNEVLTLNIETEIITETSGPIHRVVNGNRQNMLLSTGRYLSSLIPCGEFSWEVWEMKPKIDYRWRKVCDISLEAHKCNTFQQYRFNEHYYLMLTGWLKYLEVLVFRIYSQVLVFNLHTQEVFIIDLLAPYAYGPVVHKNSLVWLGGC
ncbi:hypothetical protein CASFOL_026448 [Castilleja foliolosa]|uniref:F-box domain-containing protein n=1 Tax=Castilleja foliolosa TaxID=1961234 RepID=A0ABD3CH79_9LAMI